MSGREAQQRRRTERRRKYSLLPRELVFVLLAIAFAGLTIAFWSTAVHVSHLLGLLSIAMALGVFLVRSRWASLCWLTLGVALLAPYAQYWVPNVEPRAPGCAFSVLTFNTKLTRGPDEARIADVITRFPADIIVLQEASRPEVLVEKIRAVGAFARYQSAVKADYALMILSRFPITGQLPLPGGLAAELLIAGQKVRVLTALGSRDHGGAGAVEAFFANLRAAVVADERPTIIAADLNSGPMAQGPRSLEPLILDSFATAGSGLGSTFPAPGRSAGWLGPFLRLDYILAGFAFQPVRSQVLNGHGGSTHYPVRSEFVFKGYGTASVTGSAVTSCDP